MMGQTDSDLAAAGVITAPGITMDVPAGTAGRVEAWYVSILLPDVLVLGRKVRTAIVGSVGAVGIRNPRRPVEAERCPGGQLAGVPEPASRAA